MNSKIRQLAVVVCAMIFILSATTGVVTGASDTAIALERNSGEVTVGSTAIVEIIVQNTSDGIGAINATISLSNGEAAKISDIDLDDSANVVDTQAGPAETSVTVTAYGLNTTDSGAVVVGTATVQGESPGDTDITLQVSALGDESGIDYNITSTTGTSISVSSSGGGSGGGSSPHPPTKATESPTTPTNRPTTTTASTTTTQLATTIETEATDSQASGFGPLTMVTALIGSVILVLARRSS
jgi:hypothetical protein